MSKCSEIRDICGDYAFDVEYSEDNKFTMFFNSRRNAETVKRCIEVDDSVPNVATAVDFVEVVRCKDCANGQRCNITGSYQCGLDRAEPKVLRHSMHYCNSGVKWDPDNPGTVVELRSEHKTKLTEENERLRAELTKANNDKQILFDEIALLEDDTDIAKNKIRVDTVRKIADMIWRDKSETVICALDGRYYNKQDFLDRIPKLLEDL